ncbi:MAG: hypothetical protein HQ579_01375 [Candidatus Omnitrophica bacterium]|nr:hypothetical protein [Candidatus Omnitrophota bacterium]
MKKCPFCDGKIEDAAVKCRHCAEWLIDRRKIDLCPNCRAPKKEIDFCRTCGYDFTSKGIQCVQCRLCGEWSLDTEKRCQNAYCRNVLKKEQITLDLEAFNEVKKPFKILKYSLFTIVIGFIISLCCDRFGEAVSQALDIPMVIFFWTLLLLICIYVYRCASILYYKLKITRLEPWLWLIIHIASFLISWGTAIWLIPVIILYKYKKAKKLAT